MRLVGTQRVDRVERHDQHQVPAAGIVQFVPADLEMLDSLNRAAQAEHALAERGDVRVVGQPIVMSRTPASVVSGVPEQGEHTQDILKEFGYSDTEIVRLRDRNIV